MVSIFNYKREYLVVLKIVLEICVCYKFVIRFYSGNLDCMG